MNNSISEFLMFAIIAIMAPSILIVLTLCGASLMDYLQATQIPEFIYSTEFIIYAFSCAMVLLYMSLWEK